MTRWPALTIGIVAGITACGATQAVPSPGGSTSAARATTVAGVAAPMDDIPGLGRSKASMARDDAIAYWEAVESLWDLEESLSDDVALLQEESRSTPAFAAALKQFTECARLHGLDGVNGPADLEERATSPEVVSAVSGAAAACSMSWDRANDVGMGRGRASIHRRAFCADRGAAPPLPGLVRGHPRRHRVRRAPRGGRGAVAGHMIARGGASVHDREGKGTRGSDAG